LCRIAKAALFLLRLALALDAALASSIAALPPLTRDLRLGDLRLDLRLGDLRLDLRLGDLRRDLRLGDLRLPRFLGVFRVIYITE